MYKVSEVNLTPSLSKRKMILKQICKSQIKWKLMIVISILLYFCSISIIIGSIILLIRYPTILMGIVVFICYAISIGCFPFFIAWIYRIRKQFLYLFLALLTMSFSGVLIGLIAYFSYDRRGDIQKFGYWFCNTLPTTLLSCIFSIGNRCYFILE